MSSGTSVPDGWKAKSSSSPPSVALASCLAALTERPAALITDIDGTISRIVPRPEDAIVEPGVARSLQALGRALDLVGIITAREEKTARRMVGAPDLTYVGNYGLLPGAGVEGVEAIRQARAKITESLAGLPCVTVEDKAVAFSLHYRNCDDPEAVRLRLLEAVQPLAATANARTLEGKRVIELVPKHLPDKRSAFLDLVEKIGAKGLVYLGDDLSDIAVFQEVRRHRETGNIRGVAVAVTDRETDASVREAADLSINGVSEAETLLRQLALALDGGRV